jgi:hypothetical protein
VEEVEEEVEEEKFRSGCWYTKDTYTRRKKERERQEPNTKNKSGEVTGGKRTSQHVLLRSEGTGVRYNNCLSSISRASVCE